MAFTCLQGDLTSSFPLHTSTHTSHTGVCMQMYPGLCLHTPIDAHTHWGSSLVCTCIRHTYGIMDTPNALGPACAGVHTHV